jgi:hypothetical protein
MLADKKGASVEDLTNTVLSHGGPAFAGTKADAVKFHDDKNLYTGVHSQGGPTTVDQIHPTASFGQAPATHEEEKAVKPKKTTAAVAS